MSPWARSTCRANSDRILRTLIRSAFILGTRVSAEVPFCDQSEARASPSLSTNQGSKAFSPKPLCSSGPLRSSGRTRPATVVGLQRNCYATGMPRRMASADNYEIAQVIESWVAALTQRKQTHLGYRPLALRYPEIPCRQELPTKALWT
jgi:hypothetical protein